MRDAKTCQTTLNDENCKGNVQVPMIDGDPQENRYEIKVPDRPGTFAGRLKRVAYPVNTAMNGRELKRLGI